MKFQRILIAGVLASFFAAAAVAQSALPAGIDKLGEKAKNKVQVTLDKNMLQLASQFMDGDNRDDVETKRLIKSLNGVYVRSFEFDKPGMYSTEEVAAFRKQFQPPQWSSIVSVKDKTDGDVDILMHMDHDQIKGMVIIAAEPAELTIVHIDGPIRPQDLARLSGQLGIPELKKRPKEESKPENNQ